MEQAEKVLDKLPNDDGRSQDSRKSKKMNDDEDDAVVINDDYFTNP